MDDVQFLAAVLFFICSIAAGSIIQWGVSKIKVYKPPVSILWFLFGILICLLELCVIPKHEFVTASGHEESEIMVSPDSALGLISIGIAEASRMPHNALYYLVLPILLYDATQLVNWHHFKKNIKTGLMLAVSGIVLQVFVLGALMQWSFSNTTSHPAAADPRGLEVDFLQVFHPPPPPPQWANWTAAASGASAAAEWSGDRVGSDARVLGSSGMVAVSVEPSFASSCMIAAAVGATDPIAVLGVLESLDAPAQLVSLFDCESLINDGTAIFMFTFFKSLSRGGAVSWGGAVGEFCRLLFGGPLLGLGAAAVLYRCIKHFRFHPFDVTLLVVAASYLVFFVAEIYLATSAPLAIVVFGLYFKAYAKAAFDAETARVHHTFVRGVATAMTSLVFIISGIACMRITWDTLTGAMNLELPPVYTAAAARGLGERPSSSAVRDLWHVPVFYLFCNLARALMILLFAPLIKTDLGSFSWKEGVLLWWGGLRGGVCLILALLVEQDEDIPEQLASKAALYCASAVFLILVINGTTFEFLFRWLKPYNPNPFKELYLLKVLKFVDEEYQHEAHLLHSHWLYHGTNILQYSDTLVPKLGDSQMHDIRGLQIPHLDVPNALAKLNLPQLLMPTAPIHTPDHHSPANNTERNRGDISAPSSPQLDRSRTAPAADADPEDLESGPHFEEETGHEAAARIQNLKPGSRRPHDLDLLKTVEKLHLQDLDHPPTGLDQDQDDAPPNPRKTVRWLEAPPPPPAAAAEEPVPRRPPLYKAGGYVYRIRSEPYSATLDVANTNRRAAPLGETFLGDSAGLINREADWASHFLSRRDSDAVPRTMSVPDHLGAARRVSALTPRRDTQERVRPWHREGEVVTMVVNSMRHLYRRMYEQSFISGTCLVAFMSSNDTVNDFANAEERTDKCKALWLLLEHRNVLDEAIDGREAAVRAGPSWRERCPRCGSESRQRRMARVREMVEHVTPFDLEWVLMGARLRLMSRWKSSLLHNLGRKCLCQTRTAPPPRWARRWQQFLVWLWALVGPRQIFPALDDLQTLCAYVDVHEEMLVRGDRGLRFILGHKLLRSYTQRTARGKAGVRRLHDFYPESFPYALVCHGAIFLINLKIQLVEEYHERGLLMTSDCEVILETLKRQIVRVTKYHPRFLFS